MFGNPPIRLLRVNPRNRLLVACVVIVVVSAGMVVVCMCLFVGCLLVP